MREALEALNQLVEKGLIGGYAIGGAIGASFYIEAMQTEDIDAFVFFPSTSAGLALLTPIYDALLAMGGVVDREYVRFGNWPLQILPDGNALIAQAIHDANPVDYDGVPTRVFRAEHLCAIALQVGRSKDYLRVERFLEQSAVDRTLLASLLTRYDIRVPGRIALGNLGDNDVGDR